MKIFVSWSGPRSHKAALAIGELIKGTNQAISPWISSEDIAKGGRWSAEIKEQLDVARLGIICLTPENLGSTWVAFEAGAISKAVGQSLVCPFLIDLRPTDIQGPLAQFQATVAERQDALKLMKTINASQGDSRLDDVFLEKSFDRWWPDFEGQVEKIRKLSPAKTKMPERSERDLLEEILTLVRKQQDNFGTTNVFSLPGPNAGASEGGARTYPYELDWGKLKNQGLYPNPASLRQFLLGNAAQQDPTTFFSDGYPAQQGVTVEAQGVPIHPTPASPLSTPFDPAQTKALERALEDWDKKREKKDKK